MAPVTMLELSKDDVQTHIHVQRAQIRVNRVRFYQDITQLD